MRSIIVGTAGHIDHGKSSLVKALTGTDPDRLKEEKARGITIELGFAHARVGPDVTVSFVDVPGHERFVRTMLAGVGGIDAVLLVIAADESVMPQTREHFDICRVLGLRRGAIVLTKADAVDADTLEFATLEARELVEGSFLAAAPILPVSSITGQGLDLLRSTLVDLAVATPARPDDGPVRLPVDRAFTMRGFGTVVTGTLVGGVVRVDDELELVPPGRAVKVRGVHVHGQTRTVARAGERVALNLAGVDVDDVARGAVLTSAAALRETRRVDAEVTLLPGAAPLKHGSRVRLHQGTAEVLGRVSVAGREGTVPPGGSAFVRLRLEAPAVLARRDRFILRTYSPLATIGGGVVLDPDPPRTGVRTARGADAWPRFASGRTRGEDRRTAIGEFAKAAGPAGVALASLAQRLGDTSRAVTDAIASLSADGALLSAGGWVVVRASLVEATETMLSGLAEFHRAQPLSPGVPLDDARGRWFPRTPPAVFERVVGELVNAGRVVATDTVALASHRVSLSPDEAALHEQLERRFRLAALTPPDPSLLGAELGRPQALVDRVLQVLLKGKCLARVDTLVFHTEALERLKRDIAGLKASADGGRATIDVKTFKDSYNVTRKFAIPSAGVFRQGASDASCGGRPDRRVIVARRHSCLSLSLIPDLKLRMPAPIPRPNSGSRLAPKIKITMTRMISISGRPSGPNSANMFVDMPRF